MSQADWVSWRPCRDEIMPLTNLACKLVNGTIYLGGFRWNMVKHSITFQGSFQSKTTEP